MKMIEAKLNDRRQGSLSSVWRWNAIYGLNEYQSEPGSALLDNENAII